MLNSAIFSENQCHFVLNGRNNSVKSSNEKHYLQLQVRLRLIRFGLKARLNHAEVGFTNSSVQLAKFGRPH